MPRREAPYLSCSFSASVCVRVVSLCLSVATLRSWVNRRARSTRMPQKKTKLDDESNPKTSVTQNTSCGKAASTMSSKARSARDYLPPVKSLKAAGQTLLIKEWIIFEIIITDTIVNRR